MTGTTAGRPGLLSPEFIALITSGVSTIVASHDASGRPSLMRAVGAATTPDGTRITVYLNRPACPQLLADLQATGQIAVVFSEPFSHRAVQVKACRVELRAAGPEDAPVLARYLAGMEHELGRIGFGPDYTRTMLAYQLGDVAAVSFSPEQAFDQTPGPKAGASLPPAGGMA
ncbi:MAG: pyridoxamine 5'-phosphate oxidase family protein [Pseudomonadota bacterium]|nr:pyridoxamine 5'-phosphate oxidase family protein [Pseudomonadota bacterium]